MLLWPKYTIQYLHDNCIITQHALQNYDHSVFFQVNLGQSGFKLRMIEVVSGDNCSYKSCKAPVKSSPTNQHPVFFTGRMPFLSPKQQCQSTEGKICSWQTLLALNMPSFDTIISNSRYRFSQRWKNCDNKRVKHHFFVCFFNYCTNCWLLLLFHFECFCVFMVFMCMFFSFLFSFSYGPRCL